MESSVAARVLGDWLESEITRAIGSEDRIALAYSGGLASTVIASIARKRCDITCFVVGAEDATDLRAADLSAVYLDFHVEKIRLSPSRALALVRRVASIETNASLSDLFTIAPAWAVRERLENKRLFTGFGTQVISDVVRNLLARLHTTNPLVPLSGGKGAMDRRRLTACAEILGLPPNWARPRHRPPGSGSGIERAIRGIAASHGTSVRRLVSPRDYHVQPKVQSRRFD